MRTPRSRVRFSVAVTAVVVATLGLTASPGAAGAHRDPDGDGPQMPQMPMVDIPPSAYVPSAPTLDRADWVARADSGGDSHPASMALDGSTSTFWRSAPTPGAHRLVLDLGSRQTVGALRYLPRPDTSAGSVGHYAVAVSDDGRRWTTVTTGLWNHDRTAKSATFRPVATRFVRLTALATKAGVAAADVTLRGRPDYGASPADPGDPGAGRSAEPGRSGRSASLGRWSTPIGLPIVPTSAILLPHGRVLTMSAATGTNYDLTTTKTQISIINLTSRKAGHREVTETHHQMFCTGLSILADGRVLITGGSSPSNTTIYDPASNRYLTGPQMSIPRGYQTSVTLSDRRVFTIGGSWNGGEGGKDGEVLNADATAWHRLPNDTATSILTDDDAGIFRADNHAWLFAGRHGWVFQAGPSRAMHWFSTHGAGATDDAGLRGDADDEMNGNAVMYGRDHVVAFGGAPSYSDSPATADAWTIDLSGGPGQAAPVRPSGPMPEPRGLLNSVVLPTGDVVVTGGQQVNLPFSDNGSELDALLWSPSSRTFRTLAPEAIPRNYHSWSLLLPDGRVMAGGGGLCGDCETNHPDAEIFTPPYLLRPDGTLRSRPHIVGHVPGVLHAGRRYTVTANRAVTWDLVRTGSATHSIDSDQRRLSLYAHRPNPRRHPHRYRITIPAERGTTIPGSYLLFAVDRQGTPSTSRWVRIP